MEQQSYIEYITLMSEMGRLKYIINCVYGGYMYESEETIKNIITKRKEIKSILRTKYKNYRLFTNVSGLNICLN